MKLNKDDYFFCDYEKNDFEELVIFWEQTGVGGTHRGDDHKIITDSVDNGGKLILMKLSRDHRIIGSAWVTTDKRRTYLHYFAIEEKFRNQGLANYLIDKVIQHAEKLGLQFRLEVHEKNIAAIKLYEKYDFKYLGDYDIYINRNIQKRRDQ